MSKYIHVGEYENNKVDQMRRQCVVCMCMYRPQERMQCCMYSLCLLSPLGVGIWPFLLVGSVDGKAADGLKMLIHYFQHLHVQPYTHTHTFVDPWALRSYITTVPTTQMWLEGTTTYFVGLLYIQDVVTISLTHLRHSYIPPLIHSLASFMSAGFRVTFI